jgi:3-deoxy-D-manno-octulosonate 8-phosphate phosphatase (KDO 8-P phosphatase)
MADAEAPALQDRLQAVRVIAMDVDGVLTDGGIELPGEGPEAKRFCVADGLGIQLALHAGLQIVWISGRESASVARRARELGVTQLYQGSANKALPLAQIIAEGGLAGAEVAFVGDDLNDLPAFGVCGVRVAPANAVTEVKALADLVTERPGGSGAVRELCDVILKVQGKWNDALARYLGQLLTPPPAADAAA